LNTTAQRGLAQAMHPERPTYGLHLLRHATDLAAWREIARREGAEPDLPVEQQDALKGYLDLRAKRPLVTLSLLDGAPGPEQDLFAPWLLPAQAVTFLGAGASAVVGPLWPTSEETDLLFWRSFYRLLEGGLSLGEVVRRARLEVAAAMPEGPDWLAYTLFGDPRARTYWPEESDGYAALECLNPETPLRVGRPYIFEATISSRPPEWYRARVDQVSQLPEDMQALFVAPGLDLPDVPLPMRRYGRSLLRATLPIIPLRPGDFPLLVYLMQGEETYKTLKLTLKVQPQTAPVVLPATEAVDD
jgi:hypothetical protein